MLENSRPRALLRVLRASSAAAALFPLHAGVAQAEGVFTFDERGLSVGAGVFVGYQYSDDARRRGVEWGLEAFVTRRLSGSGSCTARSGIGPLLQVGFLGIEDPRITLAVQGGGELQRGALAITGELGITYRAGSEPGIGMHLGVVPEVFLLNTALRYQALRNEAWVGGGVRYLPTYGEPGTCSVSVGRPLRSARGDCLIHGHLDAHASARPSQPTAAHLAAAGHARDAQLECDSVSAFLQLALELYVVGAPASLIDAAVCAAQDEMRHARQCAGLAEVTLREHVRPLMPAFAARAAVDAEAALVRLALESWYDGCLGEGCAARQAAWAAELSDDRRTAATLRAIARDEAVHRELAWAVLDFSLARGGEAVRSALRAAAETHSASDADDEQFHPAGLERYGRLSARGIAQLAREQRRVSQRRLAERGVFAR